MSNGLNFLNAYLAYHRGQIVRRAGWPRELALGKTLDLPDAKRPWGEQSGVYLQKETIDMFDLESNDWLIIQ